jgi:hypothetical protein
LRQSHTFSQAACAAAQAAEGKGDDPPPDEAARTRLRDQAHAWLKGELDAWSRALDEGAALARPTATRTLEHWKVDTDLAGLRDADALAKLPEKDKRTWRALWSDVDALLRRGQGQSR